MVVAAFVAPFLMPATVRFVGTAAQLPGVRLAVITTAPADQVPAELTRHLAGHWRVDDALDRQQIADAVRGLSRQLGPVERLVGALEQLQVPLAEVRHALGIPGIDVDTAGAPDNNTPDGFGADQATAAASHAADTQRQRRTLHRKVRMTLEEAAVGCIKVLRGKVTDICATCRSVVS